MSVIFVLALDDTFVQAFRFDASAECNVEMTDFFVNNWKRHMAAPWFVPLVSHASLNLHKNPVINIVLKRSNVCGFRCVAMRYTILLSFFAPV